MPAFPNANLTGGKMGGPGGTFGAASHLEGHNKFGQT